MKQKDIEQFFLDLSKRWNYPTTIVLIGGAGALTMGGSRPTLDIDFEVRLRSKGASWEAFQEMAQETAAKTGVGAQFAESIERWSLVTLLDYRRHTKRIKKIGRIDVRVLEPAYWSIGKVARYLDQDVIDMVAVFKQQKPDPLVVAKLWYRALVCSPKSTQLALVRRQALHFFETFGREIWGSSFPLDPIRELFIPKP